VKGNRGGRRRGKVEDDSAVNSRRRERAGRKIPGSLDLGPGSLDLGESDGVSGRTGRRKKKVRAQATGGGCKILSAPRVCFELGHRGAAGLWVGLPGLELFSSLFSKHYFILFLFVLNPFSKRLEVFSFLYSKYFL
jgi:hypothetical protein